MTLTQIKAQAAFYLGVDPSVFTVGGQDLWLAAANQVRLDTEMGHDFEFNRKVLTLSVDPVTGGSIEDAVIRGTATTAEIKTVIEVGIYDANANFCPVDWTTVAASLETVRKDNRYGLVPRYPTDGQVVDANIHGQQRYCFSGSQVYQWPIRDTIGPAVTLGFEAYCFTPEWLGLGQLTVTGGTVVDGTYYLAPGQFIGNNVYIKSDAAYFIFYDTVNSNWVIKSFIENDPGGPKWVSVTLLGTYDPVGASGNPIVTVATDPTSPWFTKGANFLLWATVVHLNNSLKFYVPRTEGNLQPPQGMADAALQRFMDWDLFKYEQDRRHGV